MKPTSTVALLAVLTGVTQAHAGGGSTDTPSGGPACTVSPPGPSPPMCVHGTQCHRAAAPRAPLSSQLQTEVGQVRGVRSPCVPGLRGGTTTT